MHMHINMHPCICMKECLGVFPRWQSSNIISRLKIWGKGSSPYNESQCSGETFTPAGIVPVSLASARRGYVGPASQSWGWAVPLLRNFFPFWDLINRRLSLYRRSREEGLALEVGTVQKPGIALEWATTVPPVTSPPALQAAVQRRTGLI